MEISYRREMNHNYMILEIEKLLSTYESRMIEENAIEGLLRMDVKHAQDRLELCYEITSLQPLERIIYKSLRGAEVKRIVRGILNGVSNSNAYMLSENRILLEPEYIYIDINTMDVRLCFVPEYEGNFKEALTHLLKRILDAVDRTDRDGVMLAYSLYEISERENYSSADMMRVLNDAEQGRASSHNENENEIHEYGGGGYFEHEGREEMAYGSRVGLEGRTGLGGRTGLERDCQDYSESGSEMSSSGYGWEKAEKETSEKRTSEKKTSEKKASEKKTSVWKILLPCLLLLVLGEGGIFILLGRFGLMFYGGIYGILILALALILSAVAGRRTKKVRSAAEAEMKKESVCQEMVYEKPSYQIQTETFEEFRQKEESRRQRRMEESREEGTRLLCDLDVPRKTFLESIAKDIPDIEIKYVPFVLGKHENLNDFCISRSTVSRMHVRIDRKENVTILTDLNSTNGTIVNGYRLNSNETVSLKDGDRIYLADVGFVFHEFG